MIYLDSSALLKLVVEEAESAALADWLAEHSELAFVSSELALVEVVRAVRRLAADAVPTARSLVSRLDLVPLSGPIVEAAADVGEPLLRSLDAIHLASAASLGDAVSYFVVYDQRLAGAARAEGFEVRHPV